MHRTEAQLRPQCGEIVHAARWLFGRSAPHIHLTKKCIIVKAKASTILSSGGI